MGFRDTIVRLAALPRPLRWVALSGAAALIYQITLQKLFTYVLGASLLSTTIIVGAYMAGLALGGLLAGLLGERLRPRTGLRLYLLVEGAIGVCALLSVLGYRTYLARLGEVATSPWFLELLTSVPRRALASFLIMLPLTTLIGATLPLLVRALQPEAPAAGAPAGPPAVSVAVLYAGNLIGALAGVLVACYLLLPYTGIWGATLLGVLANGLICLSVGRYRPEREVRARAADVIQTASLSPGAHPAADATPTPAGAAAPLGPGQMVLLGFLSGLALFALEIIWTHLLAAVIGTSVYAFAHMLFAVLLALALAARQEARLDPAAPALSLLVTRGALYLALTIPLYALAPLLFSVIGLASPGFFVREAARLAVACLLIVPVGLLLSRIFPRVLARCADDARPSRAVGIILFANTAGCLLGLFLGRFLLIPHWGSALSLRALAALLLLCALLAPRVRVSELLWRGRRRWLTLAALAAWAIPSWHPALLLSNRNVYFDLTAEADFSELLYQGEDAETGFITVTAVRQGGGPAVRELRTNGKFEGNTGREMEAQLSFGYLPALAAARLERAFVIGAGTGVTLRALGDLPLREIVVAELSRQVLHAARTYFSQANHGILDDPRLRVTLDDGRNALALARGRFDVISIEITSIWFAGAASLYSRDFYTLARQKLADGGVLQQWVQLHHMRLPDLWVIINTIRQVFPHVAVWYSGTQGQILASERPLGFDWPRLHALARRPERSGIPSEQVYRIPQRVLLTEGGVEELLGMVQRVVGPRLTRRLVSSDLFPYLEYATPKGNVLEHQQLLNRAYLAGFSPRPLRLPFRRIPAADRPLLEAIVAHFDGRCAEVAVWRARTRATREADLRFLERCLPPSLVEVLPESPGR